MEPMARQKTSSDEEHRVRRTALIYGALDLLSALGYALLFTVVIPSRSVAFTISALAVSAVCAAGGVGMLVRAPWGRRVAAGSALVMLGACGVLLLLLLSSAAYLHGIYDGVGQAAAAIALVTAALTIELVGLLPALQLAFLRRRRRERAQGR